ncbi:MAG: HD domain-containing protein [Bacillota bacterium]|nr:HD domain-containing protein [Bacillota bacterium]
MKKFEAQAARPGNLNWEKLIERQQPIYKREDEIRSEFARDYTRVLHSLAFRRLKHKSQVFFNGAGNDHICTRMEHVYHVDSVSSTIAIALGLNEELTKAIAIAHDLGHAPFGHEGESILSRISQRELGKNFWHEQNGLRFIDDVELLEDGERRLQNLNLTYAVRDGVISHCGELDKNCLRPREELFDLSEFNEAGKYEAATWEGCVVKLADKIAYLGRDIEDATRLGYIGEQKINTTVIMHSMIIDLCKSSSPEAGLVLSPEMSEQMNRIKAFNYENIYLNPRLEPFRRYAEKVLTELYDSLMEAREYLLEGAKADAARPPAKSYIDDFGEFLHRYTDEGIQNRRIYGDLSDEAQYKQAAIDFLAGMTDNYATKCYEELIEC